MKMSNDEILTLHSSLRKLGNFRGVKFAYGVSKNISILEREVRSLTEAMKPSPEFSKFEEERVALAKKHAKKDENGKEMTIIDGDITRYVMENEAKFNKEFEVLKKKHKKAIDERKKQSEEFNELLKTESEIDLFKISLEDVPSEISVAEMEIIKDIVKE